MRRILVICLLASLAHAAPAAAEPRMAATLERCLTGPSAEQRAASFVARMRQVAGAERMRLRFHLEHRAEGAPWRAAGALGGWRTADPGAGAYVYTKRVEGLAPAGEYRVLVRFQWLRGDGTLVAAARKRSARCAQPDTRPNLRPVAIVVERQDDGTTRYGVRVRNTGMTASGAFAVAFAVDAAALSPVAAAPTLAAGQTTLVELVGPMCAPGAVVEVVADPALAVDERREDDNALRAACPAR